MRTCNHVCSNSTRSAACHQATGLFDGFQCAEASSPEEQERCEAAVRQARYNAARAAAIKQDMERGRQEGGAVEV